MNDTLGDRMKLFEGAESDRCFMPLVPVCARLDGRSFSSFTKGLERPYDERLHNLMVDTAKYLVEETNTNMGYTQSDEISLVWHSDDIESQIFFNGRIQKMASVLASMCSVKFNQLMQNMQICHIDIPKSITDVWMKKRQLMPLFDCRVWAVPNQMEAVNTFIWREWDATKNAITMAASHYYSHNELHGKNGSEKQEMLFKKGVNFNDYPVWFKRGTYIQRVKSLRRFTAKEIDKLPSKHNARTNPDLMVERTDVEVIDMPILSTVVNRVGVFFNSEKPMVAV